MIGDCAVPNCNRFCAQRQLMCRRHWFEVPVEIRLLVGRTWRTYSAAARLADRDRFRPAREAYMQARTAAVEAVTP